MTERYIIHHVRRSQRQHRHEVYYHSTIRDDISWILYRICRSWPDRAKKEKKHCSKPRFNHHRRRTIAPQHLGYVSFASIDPHTRLAPSAKR